MGGTDKPLSKIPLGVDVLTAARERISRIFDDFPKIYVSFSGGKDSTVMLHLVIEEAAKRNRRVGVLFIDLEAQYKHTIDHVIDMCDLYKNNIVLYWIALPIHLRNAVSQFEPHWLCWDPDARERWVRQPHSLSIVDERFFPWFRRGMEFEEFTPAFAEWYADGKLCACFVGIRADESLNRFRAIRSKGKSTFEGLQWTTWSGGYTHNVYPIYDWKTKDIWTYHGRFKLPYNRLYDRMHMAGLTIHQQRICQPFGDDQRKGLWLFHVIEPETWGKVVARVSGANQGALYCRESGNILGYKNITKPDGITWEEFANRLLASMPEKTSNHYKNKIAVFLKWYLDRGWLTIPDEGSMTDRNQPSWLRICKALLRNDYWCKGLSFSQTKSEGYKKYVSYMEERRKKWGILA